MSTPPVGNIRFGAYWLLRLLAKGGMAEVYLAAPAQPGRGAERLVIKRLLPNLSQEQDFLQMFVQEARLASQLAHPNIVRILELGREAGQIYLAMEYIDGADLATLTRGRRLAPALAARIAIEVCSALSYAHLAVDITGVPMHLVHRDVTPENLMISRSGEVKLVDFGVAKASASLSMTRPGTIKGKLSYLAPEYIRGKELDGRADLFSLGTSLYSLTTGIKPFERGTPANTMAAILGNDPPAPAEIQPGYPPALSAILMKAMQKDRECRHADAKELKDELERYLDSTQQIFGSADLAALVAEVVPAGPQPSVKREATPGTTKLPSNPASPAAPAQMELLESSGGSVSAFDDEPPTILTGLSGLRTLGQQHTAEHTTPDTSRHPARSRWLAPAKGVGFAAALLGAIWIGRYSAVREMDARFSAFTAAQRQDAGAAYGPDSARAQPDQPDAAPDAGPLADAAAPPSEPDASSSDAGESSARDAAAKPTIIVSGPRDHHGPRLRQLPGYATLAFEGRGTAYVDEVSCRVPCVASVAAGEHVVRMVGKRTVEKKIAIGAGETQTLKLP